MPFPQIHCSWHCILFFFLPSNINGVLPPHLIFVCFHGAFLRGFVVGGRYPGVMFSSSLDFVLHFLCFLTVSHFDVCDHLAKLWRAFQEQLVFFMLPLLLCPNVRIFLCGEYQKLTPEVWRLISPQSSFVSFSISLWLVSLVKSWNLHFFCVCLCFQLWFCFCFSLTFYISLSFSRT